MQITLTVRHGEASDALKAYAREQIEGLARFFDRLVEADIVFDQEGHRHLVEARVHTSNDTHFARSEEIDFRTACDQTVEKLRRQIRRHKEKLSGRPMTKEERERRAAVAFALGRRSAAEGEAPPEWDRITSEEAIARLYASGEDVLVFVDTGDDVVRIARRSGDGIDVVEAEAFEVEEP